MKIYDVFISYRRRDGMVLAYSVYQELLAKGLRPFLDKEKMEDGRYFNQQIVKNLKQSPNYILIATPDVFQFRGEDDWVKKEIQLALQLYEQDPENRTINIIVPKGFDVPSSLPAQLAKLAFPNRIYLSGLLPNEAESRRILNAVTYVNRTNLWNAGHRWLQNSCESGNRFSGLTINTMLIPEATSSPQTAGQNTPIRITDSQKNASPLLERIKEASGHLCIVGEGGIGKTTTLLKIMQMAYQDQAYTRQSQIPLFIELACAPDVYGKYYEDGKSTFIRRSIYHQIRSDIQIRQVAAKTIRQIDEAFCMDPETAVYPINDLFTAQTAAPEFLLLLDGFNEISRVKVPEVDQTVSEMIFQEIRWLMEECPNTRVILTSRTDEIVNLAPSVCKLYLSGIDKQAIAEYLSGKGFPQTRISDILQRSSLAETLRIPLFLVLYAELSTDADLSAQGEILHLYFHGKQENLGTHTMRRHLSAVEKSMKSNSPETVSLRLDAKMQCFLLDFLLSEIAWNMVSAGKFYLDFEDIETLLLNILNDRGNTSPFGRYGTKLFSAYTSCSNIKVNTRYYAEKLLSMANADPDVLSEIVMNCCVFSMAVLQVKNGQFGFLHHHIRDYFAACKCVNDLKLAAFLGENEDPSSLACIHRSFNSMIPVKILSYIGEILGEHKNRPTFCGAWSAAVPAEQCDRNLVGRCLDLCRGHFDGEDIVVRNLVKILTLVREDLSGSELYDLDLTACDLAYTRLSRPGLSADLSGSKIMGATVLDYGHESWFCDLCFSPDGTHILTSNGDGSIKYWNARTLKCDRTDFHDTIPNNIQFSPDGKLLAVCNEDGSIRLWDTQKNEQIGSFETGQKRILKLSYNRDGALFSTISTDGTVKIWDTAKEAVPRTEKLGEWATIYHHGTYTCLATLRHQETLSINAKSASGFNPAADQIAVAAGQVAALWDLKTYQYHNITPSHPGTVQAVSYHPSGRYLAVAAGNTIEIWDIISFRLKGVLEGHTANIFFIQYSPDGKRLISLAENKEARLWYPEKQKCIQIWKSQREEANNACFSPEGERLVVRWGVHGELDIYDATDGSYLDEIYFMKGFCNKALYTPDNSKIITACFDGAIKLWDTDTFHCLGAYYHNWGQHFAPSSSDGAYTVGMDSTSDQKPYSYLLKIWDNRTQTLAREIPIGNEIIEDACYNPQTRLLGLASFHGFQIWDMESEKKVCELFEPESRYLFNFIDISPDGKLIAVQGEHSSVRILCRDSLQPVSILEAPKHYVGKSVFSPDGKWIATASNDHTARIWDVESFTCVHILTGHHSIVHSVQFSPDGRFVLTASSDETARIWDVKDGKCVQVLAGPKKPARRGYLHNLIFNEEAQRIDQIGHRDAILSADFSPDGSQIVTASLDGTAKIWDAASGRVLKTLYMMSGKSGNLHGVVMSHLHPDSQLSHVDKYLLEQYGVKTD